MRPHRLSLLLAAALALVAPAAPAPAAGPESINLRRTITVEVVQKTKDAIVNVSTSSLRKVHRRMSPFGNDPFFDQFGFNQVVQVPVNSLGSGFIIHPEGYVVTNCHVIDQAREITVELADGRKLPAELVSSDPEADLAVLRIHSDKPFPTLQLGDSSDLMIGEPAIAVGNPLGFSHSVSTGIISAVHRNLKGDDNKVMLSDLIQTDAAINPGNSGGPLLNAYGQVIGINTAIRGDAQNIGFAIPIDRLRDLIPELMNPALVNKVEIPVKLKEKRKLSPPDVIDASVHLASKPEAPPVASIDGRKVRNIIDACTALLAIKPGQKQCVVKLADGTEETIDIKPVPTPEPIVQARKQLGLTVEPLNPMLAEKYGLKTDTGLLVTEVHRESVAGRAGVEAGDVVVALGRYPVRSLDDLSKLLPYLPKSGRVTIGIVRGDQMGYGILQF